MEPDKNTIKIYAILVCTIMTSFVTLFNLTYTEFSSNFGRNSQLVAAVAGASPTLDLGTIFPKHGNSSGCQINGSGTYTYPSFSYPVMIVAQTTITADDLLSINGISIGSHVNGSCGGQIMNSIPAGTSIMSIPAYTPITLVNTDTQGVQIGASGVLSFVNTSIPSDPYNLVAKAISASSIQLMWQDNTYGSSQVTFQIEQSLSPVGPYNLIGQVTFSTGSSYGFTANYLSANTTYYYRVKANFSSTNLNTFSGYSNIASATTYSNPPTDPSNATSTYSNYPQISISWSDNSSNESGFLIERAVDSYGTPSFWTQIASLSANQTQYNDVPPNGSTKYYYRIRSYINSSGGQLFSGYSNVTYPPDTVGPVNPNVSSLKSKNTVITVSWNSSIDLAWSGINGYQIMRGSSTSTIDSIVGTVLAPNTTFVDNSSGIAYNTQYCYKIVAFDKAGNLGATGANGFPAASMCIKPLAPPANVILKEVSLTKNKMTWTISSSGQSGFRIESSPATAGGSSVPSQSAVWSTLFTASPTATAATFVIPTTSTLNFYRVTAYNSVSESNSVSIVDPGCYIISFGGMNDNNTEFSNTVQTLATGYNTWINSQSFNGAKLAGNAMMDAVNAARSPAPRVRLMVAAHSISAIGTFNYGVTNLGLTYALYDPPYDITAINIASYFPGGSFLLPWFSDNANQILTAKNHGIASSSIVWTNGHASPASLHSKFIYNSAVPGSGPQALQEVTNFLQNNCVTSGGGGVLL